MKHEIILVGTNGLGSGNEQLGTLIMANFLRLLGEREEKPQYIIFWNNGVKLVLEGSICLEHLKKLSDQGVKLIACRTCMEFLGVEEQIRVGEIQGMAQIQELLLAHNVLTV
jgi:intracellular sulfur oxidation DsrE/DsrF family protein